MITLEQREIIKAMMKANSRVALTTISKRVGLSLTDTYLATRELQNEYDFTIQKKQNKEDLQEDMYAMVKGVLKRLRLIIKDEELQQAIQSYANDYPYDRVIFGEGER